MPDATGPILLVVGGDSKRLQWLTHHVSSHWPSAQVTTAPAAEPAALAQLVQARTPDGVVVQIDFGTEALATAGLDQGGHMRRAQPNLYCTIVAEQGSELAAVRPMKCGAKAYLPMASLTRDSLLKAVTEACAKQRAASAEAAELLAPANDTQSS